MDIFIEQIVKKEKSMADRLLKLGIILACVIIASFLYVFVMVPLLQFSPIIFLGIAAVVYFACILIGNLNLEYEYSLVNSELDIDKIASKKRRKKLTSVNLRGLDAYGVKNSSEYEKYLKDGGVKKIFACRNKKDEDIYFLVYNEATIKKMLIFSPNEKIVAAIEKLNARKPLI